MKIFYSLTESAPMTSTKVFLVDGAVCGVGCLPNRSRYSNTNSVPHSSILSTPRVGAVLRGAGRGFYWLSFQFRKFLGVDSIV